MCVRVVEKEHYMCLSGCSLKESISEAVPFFAGVKFYNLFCLAWFAIFVCLKKPHICYFKTAVLTTLMLK